MNDEFDFNAVIRTSEEDADLAREVCQVFLEQAEPMLREVRESVQAREPQKLERAAHGLKGAAACICAHRVESIAASLELMGRNVKFENAQEQLKELEVAMQALVEAVWRSVNSSKP